jgi:hypothetical protein
MEKDVKIEVTVSKNHWSFLEAFCQFTHQDPKALIQKWIPMDVEAMLANFNGFVEVNRTILEAVYGLGNSE